MNRIESVSGHNWNSHEMWFRVNFNLWAFSSNNGDNIQFTVIEKILKNNRGKVLSTDYALNVFVGKIALFQESLTWP